MRTFLKSIDEWVWLNIAREWKQPIIVVDGAKIPKNVENWPRD